MSLRPPLLSLRVAAIFGVTVSLLHGCGDAPSPEGVPVVSAVADDSPEDASDAAIATKAVTGVAATGRWEKAFALINKDGNPLSPSAAANLPDGRVLVWSADNRLTFGSGTRSFTAVIDPSSGKFDEYLMTESGHNLFCPGTSQLPDGRILVNGGSQNKTTTLFDPTKPSARAWSQGADMNRGRGYQGNTVLRDGSVLTFGGSWNGDPAPSDGERWTASGSSSALDAWTALPGVRVEDAITNDAGGVGRADNHMWLIPTGNGKVLHAGPSAKMHWITTEGRGDIVFAGRRGNDDDAMLGTAVMFDTGRILKVGGAKNYSSSAASPTPASASAFVIDARHGLTVTRVENAEFARSLLSSVVLPNGRVMVLGGQAEPRLFTDELSVLAPELYDPVRRTFKRLASMPVPRNYHSAALLLHDGRVFVTGGNLGATQFKPGSTDVHSDFQIYTPGYLFTSDGKAAVRPKILQAPEKATYGTTVTVRTDSKIASMALVRLSSATHQVNNDQRRLSLRFTARGNNVYDVAIPSNPGWAVPGNYMLFTLSAGGVPSVARTVNIGAFGAPMVERVDDRRDAVGVPVTLRVTATGTGVRYETDRTLPPGVVLDSLSGVFSGSPTQEGTYKVTVTASNSAGATSTEFVWTVAPAFATRFVRLEADGPDVGGGAGASMAEITLSDVWGNRVPSADWKVSASSEQEGYPATAVIDGNPATFWQSRYAPSKPRGTHQLTIDLGRSVRVGAISALPRQDGSQNGMLRLGRVLVSDDGRTWTVAWAGDVSALAARATPLIRINDLARGRPATQSSVQASLGASRAVDGVSTGDFRVDRDITHTQREAAPWWQVDLGSVQNVSAVRLWNRTDCCGERLRNLQVFLSDIDMGDRSPAELAADPRVVAMPFAGTVGRWAGLAPSGGPARARYVRVQLNGTDVLSLSEVQVFGWP